jgi:hypothetical protein
MCRLYQTLVVCQNYGRATTNWMFGKGPGAYENQLWGFSIRLGME